MTSPSPLLYGVYYHLYNRGINGEDIFIQERNYEYFLNLYARHLGHVTDLFAYCMLRNHFHLLIRVRSGKEIAQSIKAIPANHIHSAVEADKDRTLETQIPNARYASDRFSNFFNAYAKGINRSYGRTGSLFQHPFGRVRVTNDRQFWNVVAYINQNPQKHGFVKDFREWKWSSYGVLLSDKTTQLQRDVVLDWFGGKDAFHHLHDHWVTEAECRWFAEDDFD